MLYASYGLTYWISKDFIAAHSRRSNNILDAAGKYFTKSPSDAFRLKIDIIGN